MARLEFKLMAFFFASKVLAIKETHYGANFPNLGWMERQSIKHEVLDARNEQAKRETA